MNRRYFHIVHHLGGGWDFKEQDQHSVIKNDANKDALIQFAVIYCRKMKSELIIHDHWGEIEDRRTYGQDPFPPRG